jgi:adenine-specific DNA-methyltransferase
VHCVESNEKASQSILANYEGIKSSQFPGNFHLYSMAVDRFLEGPAPMQYHFIYIDPPYNQHKYLGNYHIWESLVRWDHPEVYGVARKRVDCRQRSSAFNSRPGILGALRAVIRAARAPNLLVSFSNEGFISRADMESMLGERGEVQVIEHDFRRYVGARIGIYNPSGERVGKVSHVTNKEYLYLVTSAREPSR